jgi:hypothetical protein
MGQSLAPAHKLEEVHKLAFGSAKRDQLVQAVRLPVQAASTSTIPDTTGKSLPEETSGRSRGATHAADID